MRIFDEFFSGFRAKFQKRVTSVAFQSNLRRQNKHSITEISEICENQYKLVTIIQYYSILSLAATGGRDPREGRFASTTGGAQHRREGAAEEGRWRHRRRRGGRGWGRAGHREEGRGEGGGETRGENAREGQLQELQG